MLKDFIYNGINWEGEGYFFDSNDPSRLPESFPGIGQIEPFEMWLSVFNNAKKGNFFEVSNLIKIIKYSEGCSLTMDCSRLIGDVGTSECFQQVIEEIKSTEYFYIAEQLCYSLVLRGRLCDIPVLLETYNKFQENRNSDVILSWLSDLLGFTYSEPFEHGGIQEYNDMVMKKYQKLTDYFLTDKVLIFEGKEYGVNTHAKYILKYIKKSIPFDYSLRHKFEAATGINCSKFYYRGRFHALAATSLIEDFLESDNASKYKKGSRYFFGFCVPD